MPLKPGSLSWSSFSNESRIVRNSSGPPAPDAAVRGARGESASPPQTKTKPIPISEKPRAVISMKCPAVLMSLLFGDQLVDEFFGAADCAVTVAMRADLLFCDAHFHDPHPTSRRARLYDLKLDTSVLHSLVANLRKYQATYRIASAEQRRSLIRLDVRAKG